MDIWIDVLKEILKPVLAGLGSLLIGWLVWGRKKENKIKSELAKDTFNNYDEMVAKYLLRLDTHAEHIHRLQEALMKSRHDDGKKRNHINNIIEVAEKHKLECSNIDDDFANLLRLLKEEYVKG